MVSHVCPQDCCSHCVASQRRGGGCAINCSVCYPERLTVIQPTYQLALNPTFIPQKIVAAIGFRNEADFYLERVIKDLQTYVDEIVAVDDNSTDNSVTLVQSLGVPVTKNPGPSFLENPKQFKEFVLNLALKKNPNWILRLDADEIVEPKFKKDIRAIAQGQQLYVQFKFAHMWDEKYYIHPFAGGKSARRFFKVYQDLNPATTIEKVHGSSIPSVTMLLPDSKGWGTEYTIKHYGFANPAMRIRRIERQEHYIDKFDAKSLNKYIDQLKRYDSGELDLREWKES